MIELNERYNHEREYWDRQIGDVLKDSTHDFKLSNLSTFEELSKTIHYLQPIMEFWGPIHCKTVLDLACGDGWISLSLAKSGAVVYGCDISPNRIKVAARYAKENDLESTVHFETMIAEEITYEDNFFDFVIMHAALHHCDVEKTTDQIRRVLKPGGKAVFIEDYAYHPLMNLYRWLTPWKHTETEEALTDEDLEVIVSKFSAHYYKYYGIFNLVEASHYPLMRKMKPLLRLLDHFLCKQFPSIVKYSKIVEIFVVK